MSLEGFRGGATGDGAPGRHLNHERRAGLNGRLRLDTWRLPHGSCVRATQNLSSRPFKSKMLLLINFQNRATFRAI
jgi:hypothetical protein